MKKAHRPDDDPGDLAHRWAQDEVELYTDQQWPGLHDFMAALPEPAPSQRKGADGTRGSRSARSGRNAASA